MKFTRLTVLRLCVLHTEVPGHGQDDDHLGPAAVRRMSPLGVYVCTKILLLHDLDFSAHYPAESDCRTSGSSRQDSTLFFPVVGVVLEVTSLTARCSEWVAFGNLQFSFIYTVRLEKSRGKEKFKKQGGFFFFFFNTAYFSFLRCALFCRMV